MSEMRAKAALARVPCGDGFEAAAVACLSAAELERHVTLRHPRRRREWLAGRVLAKILLSGKAPPDDACHDWPSPFPNDWEILCRPDGAPRAVRRRPSDRGSGGPHLSLSHAGGWLLVGLAGDMRLGVDVEEIGPAPLQVVSTADAAAADWIAGARPPDRPRLATLVWSLKEAAAKAGRFGPSGAAAIAAAPILPDLCASRALDLVGGGPGWSGLPVRVARGPVETAYVRTAGRTAVASLVFETPSPSSCDHWRQAC